MLNEWLFMDLSPSVISLRPLTGVLGSLNDEVEAPRWGWPPIHLSCSSRAFTSSEPFLARFTESGSLYLHVGPDIGHAGGLELP